MVKKIVRDPLFLAQKSVEATEADRQVVTDLLDTLKANLDHCVGMAANMIGIQKNIIVVAAGPFQFPMINPVITKKVVRSRRRRDACRWMGCVHAPDIRQSKWIIWIRILSSSMENIPAGQHRSSSMR